MRFDTMPPSEDQAGRDPACYGLRLGIGGRSERRASSSLALLGCLVSALCGRGAPCVAAEPVRPGDRPNVVFILADDLGYGDLACYGREDVKTPALDRLAREGVRFTDHYANGPECTPTRAALISGVYPQRFGGLDCAIGVGDVGRYDEAQRLAEMGELGLPTDPATLPRLLSDVGYATCLSGKWHLGYREKFSPNAHGFDRAFECVGGGMDYFHYIEGESGDYVLRLDGRPVRRHGYFTDLVANEAADFIERHRDRPFFVYAAFTAPHSPFQGPADYRPEPLPADSTLRNQGSAPPDVYVAMIEHLDRGVGQILDTLDDLGLADETLVIFASDNGGTGSGRNAPFSGNKGQTFEGGIRVPGIARWPGVLPTSVECRVPCLTFDFTRSIARAAGVPPERTSHFDGVDILRHLADGTVAEDRPLFWHKQRGTDLWKGVRLGSLKYVAHEKIGTSENESLYDLDADPAERRDLKSQRPEDLDRLRTLYLTWEREVRRDRR